MRIVSEQAGYEVLSIIQAIKKDKDSWEGWRCLRVETPQSEACNKLVKGHSDLIHLLSAQFKDVEGAIYLCNAGEILVFCKSLPEQTLESIGQQASDLLVEETGLAAKYTVLDIYKNPDRLAEIYTYDCLVQEKETGVPHMLEKPSCQFSNPYNKIEPGLKIDGCKVLLVEDDLVIRWAVRGVLKDECLLATAQDFNSAISLYHAYKPDLVFLDINLPGKSGREVMTHILEFDPGAYIVICSSHDSMENIVGFLEGGARGFIAKPFRKEKLLQYVHGCPH